MPDLYAGLAVSPGLDEFKAASRAGTEFGMRVHVFAMPLFRRAEKEITTANVADKAENRPPAVVLSCVALPAVGDDASVTMLRVPVP